MIPDPADTAQEATVARDELVVDAAVIDQRREQFLAMISAYSEERRSAGWMRDVEQEIRAAGGLWIALAAACCGWPIGYMAAGGWDELSEEERSVALAMSRSVMGAPLSGTTDPPTSYRP
jgi:F0F1-type ATP synthase membrane subunit c/vacuolar-type H+-ATPase subunit K